MTIRHPDVPAAERGTFIGLTHPSMLKHYRALSITAIELMPVQHFIHASHLHDNGLRNYWGYDPIGFFAPHAEYASGVRAPGTQVKEFKEMVRRLHGEGIEVILDVVFNHTCEGNYLGPTLSMRGIDNRAYYRLERGDNRSYANFTNTGNALNAAHPRVLQLITDALRYWVTEMHVDGFRFDLAPVLVRDTDGEFTDGNSLLVTVQQDPVLSRVKLLQSRGTPATAAIVSERSRPHGESGTIAFATGCANSGADGKVSPATLHLAYRVVLTYISAQTADPATPSTSSPVTTDSLSTIWLRTNTRGTNESGRQSGRPG
jgi:pullulanase/glycogen debranching enzyme